MSKETNKEQQTPTEPTSIEGAWPHRTVVAFSSNKSQLQTSMCDILEHLFLYGPDEPDLDFNLGIETLFEILRHTFQMKEEYDFHVK